MNCGECDRLERSLLEAMVAADSAETALRCYLMTHQRSVLFPMLTSMSR